MNKKFDVIVIGTGAMGSAAAYHLAKQNKKVLGIDRYAPPHKMGSSHGETRIIREAYFEGPQYVPIVQRAYQNWEILQKEYGQQLYLPTGGLMIGRPECEIVRGTKLSADLYQLPYRVLSAKETMKQYPAFQMEDDMIAVWEQRAGIVFPEKCIAAHISIAKKHGADFRFDEEVIGWEKAGDNICVTTTSRKYYTKQLLLTAGAWLNNFLKNNLLPLSVERQVLYWFQPLGNNNLFKVENFPIFIWTPHDNNDFYGFPDIGSGIKIAKDHRGESADPDTINRTVKQEEIDVIREFLNQYIPDANGKLTAAEVCMYTNTPDFNFYISLHPEYQQVLIASICSGHGFKFSSAIGEILTDILLTGKTSFDLSLFGYHSGE